MRVLHTSFLNQKPKILSFHVGIGQITYPRLSPKKNGKKSIFNLHIAHSY